MHALSTRRQMLRRCGAGFGSIGLLSALQTTGSLTAAEAMTAVGKLPASEIPDEGMISAGGGLHLPPRQTRHLSVHERCAVAR